MAERPNSFPEWATGASASVEEPSTAKKRAGWLALEAPAVEWINWLFTTIYLWIVYLDAGNTQQVTIQALYGALSDTQVGILNEPPSLFSGAPSADVVILGTNGPYLVRATTSANPVVVARGALGTTLRTLTRANAGTNRAIHVRGDYCAVAYGNYVDAFKISTGARLWSVDHGATVRAVWFGRTYVYLAGDTGTGSKEVRSVYVVNGTAANSYAHGATVYAICESGEQVFIGGAGGSGGSHELVALSTSLGATPNWAISYAKDVISIETDERGIFVCTEDNVLSIDRADGSTLWETARFIPAGYLVSKIAVDQGGVWVLLDDGSSSLVYGLDKKSGGAFARETSGLVSPGRGITSDGAAIWVCQNGSASNGIIGLYRPNKAGQWYRLAAQPAAADFPDYGYRATPRYVSWLMQPLNED